MLKLPVLKRDQTSNKSAAAVVPFMRRRIISLRALVGPRISSSMRDFMSTLFMATSEECRWLLNVPCTSDIQQYKTTPHRPIRYTAN